MEVPDTQRSDTELRASRNGGLCYFREVRGSGGELVTIELLDVHRRVKDMIDARRRSAIGDPSIYIAQIRARLQQIE